jgi:hypothetical protein
MTWDHFSWDAVVFTSTRMKNLKLGIGRKDPVLLQVTDSVIAGATGNAALANPPVTLAELGTLKTAAATAITVEVQSREACLLASTERQNAVDALRVALKQYATYAYSMLGGDKAAMQALGLDVVEGGEGWKSHRDTETQRCWRMRGARETPSLYNGVEERELPLHCSRLTCAADTQRDALPNLLLPGSAVCLRSRAADELELFQIPRAGE